MRQSTCITKHMKCRRKPVSTNMVVTQTFWTDGSMMTNAANICQILGGRRKTSFKTMKSHWKAIPTLQQDKKEGRTRNHGNSHRMQRIYKDHWISAVTLNRQSRHAKDCTKSIQRSLEVETHLSFQSNKSDKGAINSLKALKNTIIDLKLLQDHNAFVFIFVITMATKQRLVVNVELGFVEIFILEWAVIFSSIFPDEIFFWKNKLARNSISWQPRRRRHINSTPTTHMFFSCACPSLLSQLFRYIQPHSHALIPRTAWLKITEHIVGVLPQKTVTLHRALSYVVPHLITPSTGTLSLSSTLFSSHVLHPPLSEHKPCGDLRPHLSGALAEPRPFTKLQLLQSWSPIMKTPKREKPNTSLLTDGLNSEVSKSASQATSLILRNMPEPLWYGLAKLTMHKVLTVSSLQHLQQESRYRTSRNLISRLQGGLRKFLSRELQETSFHSRMKSSITYGQTDCLDELLLLQT